MAVDIIEGDCLEVLRTLPAASVNCCVTSPPYWGLRDYGCAGQIGLEPTPQKYVAKLVAVFSEVRRVLRDDGTLWMNLGDSYATSPAGNFGKDMSKPGDGGAYRENKPKMNWKLGGLKPKDLCGIPWRVAFALQADGWYLRSDIIWAKPNPMPESVTDRPTRAHEYIFLLSKSERYYYDCDAVREPYSQASLGRYDYALQGTSPTCNQVNGDIDRREREKHIRPPNPLGRNKRDVWTVTSEPFKDAHFATFPPDLIKPCILAGCPVGGTVLDPFGGSGTTGMVATELGRNAILIELNPAYIALANNRTNVTPGLALT